MKIINVLDALPKSEQPVAKELLRGMHFAENRAQCEKKRDRFNARYKKSQPKAVETLARDWDRLVTFFDFPQEHWTHLRTTNIVESPFSAVRLRTDAARRHQRVENATALIWKLLKVAEKQWRSLKGAPLLKDVYAGKLFVDGRLVSKKSDKVKAIRLIRLHTFWNDLEFPALQVAVMIAYLWHAQLNREPSFFEIQAMWMLLNERKETIDVWRKDTFAEIKERVIERRSASGDWSQEEFERAQQYLESLD
jgi:hypothetical protein